LLLYVGVWDCVDVALDVGGSCPTDDELPRFHGKSLACFLVVVGNVIETMLEEGVLLVEPFREVKNVAGCLEHPDLWKGGRAVDVNYRHGRVCSGFEWFHHCRDGIAPHTDRQVLVPGPLVRGGIQDNNCVECCYVEANHALDGDIAAV
jgi:hypothetical protein